MSILTANDTMYVCPDCGSASVEFSNLVGGKARCTVCNWEGTKEQLLSVPFDNRRGSPNEVVVAMRNDLRRTFSESARGFILFLIKWGFVPAVDRYGSIEVANHKVAVRYMNAIAAASLNAIFELRQTIEKEKANG
jgi:hypothetical protein